MGRLGLAPSTLRPDRGRAQASVSIDLCWSEGAESSQTSDAVSANLLLRLQNWLHELDFDLVGVMRSEDSDGRIIEMAIDIRRR